ncbi:hypothetical protein ACJRO7_027224, partial [Eucalyptus globulus]
WVLYMRCVSYILLFPVCIWMKMLYVYRCQGGRRIEVSINDAIVGDVVLLKIGDQ